MLELLDTEGREPSAGTDLPGKPDQFRDLGVVDSRDIDRSDQKIDPASGNRTCGCCQTVDIEPVNPGKFFCYRGIQCMEREVDPVKAGRFEGPYGLFIEQ